jgi:hypothetical protein
MERRRALFFIEEGLVGSRGQKIRERREILCGKRRER